MSTDDVVDLSGGPQGSNSVIAVMALGEVPHVTEGPSVFEFLVEVHGVRGEEDPFLKASERGMTSSP